jgi:hypothetical protein
VAVITFIYTYSEHNLEDNIFVAIPSVVGATSRAGAAYSSGAPEFTPGFSGVRVT